MEAKPFLRVIDEMGKNLLGSFDDRNNAQCNSIRAGWCDKLIHISELYSIPFHQELIPEIFKYWHKSEFSNDFVNVKDGCIWFRDSQYTIRTDKNNPLTGTILMTPRTVDDFVNDCSRVGIDLFWKEEIINKYFR